MELARHNAASATAVCVDHVSVPSEPRRSMNARFLPSGDHAGSVAATSSAA